MDGTFGGRKEDGSWSGMVGMIDQGLSDVAIADFYASADRATAVDFLVPVHLSP